MALLLEGKLLRGEVAPGIELASEQGLNREMWDMLRVRDGLNALRILI